MSDGTQLMEQRAQLYGVMGEFETAHQLLHAAEQVRDAGYKHMDAYAPFPVASADADREDWIPSWMFSGVRI